MAFKADIKGLRTFIFSVVALGFLTSGFAMALDKPAAGVIIFSSFAVAVVGIVAAVAGKSAISALGQGTGVKGAVNALMTDSKPGDPPANPPAGKAT
jgi:hypothetical protein